MMDVLPPTGDGRRFVRHTFVCTSTSSCDKDGRASAMHAQLKERLKQSGLKEQVRINKAGCLGQCGHGPMAVAYPEGVWYSHVPADASGIDAIWNLATKGIVDERLRYETPRAGTNVFDSAEARVVAPHSEPCSRCPTSVS